MPRSYAAYFRRARKALNSHRGRDQGALGLARALSADFAAPLFFSETSRLLVDLNRRAENPKVFSEFSRDIADDLIALYHAPYRRQVAAEILRARRRGRDVIHLSIHSFTPVLRGLRRPVEIGILFDPRSKFEREIARSLQTALRVAFPRWRIARNRPYRGDGDGLTTHLRILPARGRYAGIELEFNYRVIPRSRGRVGGGACSRLCTKGSRGGSSKNWSLMLGIGNWPSVTPGSVEAGAVTRI